MKDLGTVFQAKGPARPRPEVGESLSCSTNRKAVSGQRGNDRGEVRVSRDQGKKLGLSSKESRRRLISRE